MVAIGVNASAFFIIAANSFMQHPVGAVYNPETGRAELVSITELLTNNTALAAFPHTVAGSLLTASTFVAGICGWWMVRSHKVGTLDDARTMYRPAAIGACAVMILSGAALAATGDVQGKLMFQQQPMKMASAESLCYTEKDPKFSVLTVGTHNNCASVAHAISVPYVLPFLAEGKFTDVTLKGVEDLQKEYEQKFGPRNYRPNLFVTYWSFRAMIGLAAGSALLALAGLWVTRGGRIPSQRWFAWLSILAIPTPFLANSAGWVFTEMGRQPWVVAPNPTGVEQIRLTVDLAVSHHSAATVWLSLITFTLLYGALGVVWFWLIRRYTIEGPLEHDTEPASPVTDDDSVKPLSFAY